MLQQTEETRLQLATVWGQVIDSGDVSEVVHVIAGRLTVHHLSSYLSHLCFATCLFETRVDGWVRHLTGSVSLTGACCWLALAGRTPIPIGWWRRTRSQWGFRVFILPPIGVLRCLVTEVFLSVNIYQPRVNILNIWLSLLSYYYAIAINWLATYTWNDVLDQEYCEKNKKIVIYMCWY